MKRTLAIQIRGRHGTDKQEQNKNIEQQPRRSTGKTIKEKVEQY